MGTVPRFGVQRTKLIYPNALPWAADVTAITVAAAVAAVAAVALAAKIGDRAALPNGEDAAPFGSREHSCTPVPSQYPLSVTDQHIKEM